MAVASATVGAIGQAVPKEAKRPQMAMSTNVTDCKTKRLAATADQAAARDVVHRRHLEHTFFSDRFSAILHLNFAKFQQNFSDFSEI